MFGTHSISTVIRITLMILFIALFFGAGGSIYRFTSLDPVAVLEGMELWRLLTWPFAPGAGSLLLGALAFGEPAERIEDLLGTRRFALILLLITLGCGILHLLIFSGSAVPLAGMLVLSLSLALSFVYVFPHGESRILFFNLSNRILALVIAAVALLLLALQVSELGDPLILVSGGPLPALLLLGWIHLRYRQSSLFPTLTRRLEQLGGEGGERELMRARFGHIAPVTREHHRPHPSKRADALLEKIAEQGIESLTEEERAFLEDYSRRL